MDARFYASLPASDMERAKKWYRDHLGMEPTKPTATGGVLYQTGGTMFMLYPSEGAGTNEATAGAFVVDDFDAAAEEMRSKGITFMDLDLGGIKTVDGVATGPDGGKGAWFTDSEGNILALSDIR